MNLGKRDVFSIVGVAGVLLSGVLLLNCFTIVTAESQASVTSFGNVHKGKVLEGFNLTAPWWDIDEYNNLLTTLTLDDRGIPSQDKFKTQMDISYTGRFRKGQASNIRASTGTATEFLSTHVDKKVRSCTIGAGTRVINSQAFFDETIQIEMAQYVLDCVNAYLGGDSVGGGYELTQVQFTDIRLDPVVRQFMVTTKQRQEQEEQQSSSLRIADLKAQEVTKVSAANYLASEDNKKAAKNASDAKLYDMQQEAKGNFELSQSLSLELVKYIEAKRWDGARSRIVSGAGTELLVDTREK